MLDPDKIAFELLRAGEEWADLNAAADALERMAKSVEAKCFLESHGNIEERKAKARNDPEYVEASENSEEARRKALKARVRYDTFKTKAELMRSVESTKRAEMRL